MPAKSSLNIFQKLVLRLIVWYQQVLSPDHSPRRVQHPYGYCRFTPTCSEYGYTAVEKYGVWRGLILATWRVLRCNPLSAGGFDPVK